MSHLNGNAQASLFAERFSAAEAACAHAGEDWTEAAYALLLRHAQQHERFQIQEVRRSPEGAALPPPPDLRAWGALAVRAMREGILASDVWAYGRHASLKRVWRSLIVQKQTKPSTKPSDPGMTNLQYKIKPHITEGGDIVIQTSLDPVDPFDNIREQITTRVIHMQDQAVRDALVRLGWTPPPELRPPPATPLGHFQRQVDECRRDLSRYEGDVLGVALVELGLVSWEEEGAQR